MHNDDNFTAIDSRDLLDGIGIGALNPLGSKMQSVAVIGDQQTRPNGTC